MMHELLESGTRRRPRRTGWTVASAVAHATIIAAAVAVTTRPTHVVASPEPVTTPIYIPVPPGEAPAPRQVTRVDGLPRIEVPRIRNLVVEPIAPTFDAGLPPSPVAHDPFGPGLTTGTPAPGGDPVSSGPYRVETVDRVVVPLSTNRQPDFPPALRSAGVEGEVVVTFVVDSTGRVERSSIAIVQATHDQFADAVRRWLPTTRYRPAEVGRAKVRQLVQQTVGFTLLR